MRRVKVEEEEVEMGERGGVGTRDLLHRSEGRDSSATVVTSTDLLQDMVLVGTKGEKGELCTSITA